MLISQPSCTNTAIDALRAKMEENKCHQRKLHQLSVQREQLQIKMLEQEIEHKANLHTLQIQRDHDVGIPFLIHYFASELFKFIFRIIAATPDAKGA